MNLDDDDSLLIKSKKKKKGEKKKKKSDKKEKKEKKKDHKKRRESDSADMDMTGKRKRLIDFKSDEHDDLDNKKARTVEHPSSASTATNAVETTTSTSTSLSTTTWSRDNPRPMVESSALPPDHINNESDTLPNVTLLLFYQYVEPPWDDKEYKKALHHVQVLGNQSNITGRMRVAKEGLNCTLTSSETNIKAFCQSLRDWKSVFYNTEFKLTHHLPDGQRFPELKIIPVLELVHYGLEGNKAPPIDKYSGVHLEPSDYHTKLAEPDTVVIDVRNHYEAAIGRFDPPSTSGTEKWIDPKMRRSTEFPVWLDDPETKKKLEGKQVLMYCTGGIRCERASALLKYKMETDPDVQKLGIKGVYQLQGGIDKYFKEFPDGGYWKGKNYTFDKRFAHKPVLDEEQKEESKKQPLGKCEACGKPWDKFRGKRRCPTCGVPSLICKECWTAHEEGKKKIDRSIRCDLCVEQNIQSKRALKEKEMRDIDEYESRKRAEGLLCPSLVGLKGEVENPNKVTRLFLKNMCRNNMTEEILLNHLSGITHIVWRTDRKSGQFFGQGWVEMESPEAAAQAVFRSGEKVLGRPLYISFQPPDGKDVWPPPNSAIQRKKE